MAGKVFAFKLGGETFFLAVGVVGADGLQFLAVFGTF